MDSRSTLLNPRSVGAARVLARNPLPQAGGIPLPPSAFRPTRGVGYSHMQHGSARIGHLTPRYRYHPHVINDLHGGHGIKRSFANTSEHFIDQRRANKPLTRRVGTHSARPTHAQLTPNGGAWRPPLVADNLHPPRKPTKSAAFRASHAPLDRADPAMLRPTSPSGPPQRPFSAETLDLLVGTA